MLRGGRRRARRIGDGVMEASVGVVHAGRRHALLVLDGLVGAPLAPVSVAGVHGRGGRVTGRDDAGNSQEGIRGVGGLRDPAPRGRVGQGAVGIGRGPIYRPEEALGPARPVVLRLSDDVASADFGL